MLVNRLPELLKARKITIQEVAKGTGLAYGTVRHVVMGHTDRIDLNTIDKLCGYFQVQPDRLFRWVPDAPKEANHGD